MGSVTGSEQKDAPGPEVGSVAASVQKHAEHPIAFGPERSRVPLQDDPSNNRWMAPWLGEWTYIIKNQVHSFDITLQKNCLLYTERVGPTIVHGLVNVHNSASNSSACITVKKMNFEIHLNRLKMVARYRSIGSSKWTKEIDVLKVEEITDEELDEEELSHDDQSSDRWNKNTLRNTWKNATVKGCRDEEVSNLPSLPSVKSLRGSSIRQLNSLRFTQQGPSVESDEIVKLMKKNSTRRSIRFAKDETKALVESLTGAE